ncbi:Phenylacetaldoxime dehydratase [Fulvia fulva]|nr:Phenylacetaldoxime dehydratase [Fulvia fulva]KAK4632482.1 Phenylacetaldoxime dehydratase [Fulvia fulva]WPV11983.1 Phenylacetaldoxime dehydratase [Fulvia fulva]WPV26535.1 Phenylacetaldoxime dehydratase [Fulvia fulva]
MGSVEVLESAIPEHLRVERTIPANTPANYQPPFPAYSARFPKDAQGMVTAMIGVQHKNAVQGQSTEFKQISSFVEKPSNGVKPRYWEAASVKDNRGYYNEVAIPYWRSKEDFDQWRSESGFESWWKALQTDGEVGYFLEVFLPSIDRFETVLSDNNEPEGVANMRVGVSGMLQEHVYWGSMRDRLAASQTDHLTGEKATIRPAGGREDTTKRRIHVEGRQNSAMIRSGQDWSNTNPHERKLYLDTMHPVLIKGMDFLRDRGEEVGCIECRFMDVIQKDEAVASPTDKTFGLAYFDDLSSLEDWSKRHKTHLDIFGRFLQYAGELQGNVSLRLFHEVMVVKLEQQYFEYVGCHDSTGMLASI